jgi:hypothetical protein
MYMQRKEFMKEMDMLLIIYVYSTDDTGTSKTYDRTEYFKIKDQIRENMKTIQLIGYHDNNWCWIITDNIYIYLCIMMLHVYN